LIQLIIPNNQINHLSRGCHDTEYPVAYKSSLQRSVR
jgi:hypothetical protein